MRSIYAFLLTAALILFSNSTSAQGFDIFLNSLSQVPKFFSDLLSKTDEIARTQDREKFSQIGMQLYRNIDKLIIAKKQLINKINSSAENDEMDFQLELDTYLVQLENFNKTLEKSEQLSDKLGLHAVKLSGELRADFLKKEWILKELKQNNIRKEKAIKNLNRAIETLEDAKQKIDAFISALDKQ